MGQRFFVKKFYIHRSLTNLLMRFGLVSMTNTVFSLISFQPLYFAFTGLLDDIWILLIAHVMNVSFSFFTHRNFTFQTKNETINRFIKFTLYHLVQFVAAYFFIILCVEATGVPIFIVQPATTLILITANFFIYKGLIFKLNDR